MARSPPNPGQEATRPHRRSPRLCSKVEKPARVSRRCKTKLGPPIQGRTSEKTYDALIRYVRGLDNARLSALTHDKDRPFVTPSQILPAAGQTGRNTTTILETMPIEILLMITKYLGDVDRISLALTSTRMAGVAQSDLRPTRGHIAIHSRWRPRDGVSRSVWLQEQDIPKELRPMVQKWMGSQDYHFCNKCQKFRPADERFWVNLFIHKWPDQPIFYRKSWPGWSYREFRLSAEGWPYQKHVNAKRRAAAIVDESRRLIVRSLLDHWRQGSDKYHSWLDEEPLRICPAHIFKRYSQRGPNRIFGRLVD